MKYVDRTNQTLLMLTYAAIKRDPQLMQTLRSAVRYLGLPMTLLVDKAAAEYYALDLRERIYEPVGGEGRTETVIVRTRLVDRLIKLKYERETTLSALVVQAVWRFLRARSIADPQTGERVFAGDPRYRALCDAGLSEETDHEHMLQTLELGARLAVQENAADAGAPALDNDANAIVG